MFIYFIYIYFKYICIYLHLYMIFLERIQDKRHLKLKPYL